MANNLFWLLISTSLKVHKMSQHKIMIIVDCVICVTEIPWHVDFISDKTLNFASSLIG